MRPYKVEGKYYDVPSSTGSVRRRTRLAAGMTATVRRQRKTASDAILPLLVHGTYDTLAKIRFTVSRSPRVCKCCGQRVQAVVLNDKGRSKLARMRSKALAHFVYPNEGAQS